MAEGKSAGKGSYVSLSMDDMKESKHSEKNDEEEERKRDKSCTEGSQSVLKDFLDEFNEVFRRKVSLTSFSLTLLYQDISLNNNGNLYL